MENMWLALSRYGTCLHSELCYLQNSKTTYLLKYVWEGREAYTVKSGIVHNFPKIQPHPLPLPPTIFEQKA